MKTSKRKILTVLLIVTFILAALSGCGGGSGESEAAAPPASTETPEQAQSETHDTQQSSPSGIPVAGEILQFGGFDWRVLDVQGDKVLIITENVIERRPYHDKKVNVSWEICDLREYLNKEFYDNAFSVDEKALIVETKNTNQNNQKYGTNGGNDTTDKVFLLSIDEVVRYFGDSGQLENIQSGSSFIDDQYNENRISETQEGEAVKWVLRSPGSDTLSAAFVWLTGTIAIDGYSVNEVYGVRPVLWMNL